MTRGWPFVSRMNYRRVESERRASRVTENPVRESRTVKIIAKYPGKCAGCGRSYSAGSTVKPAGLGVKGWRHLKC